MSGYFITGTGTGVGKTFTTRALIHAFRGAGRAVTAAKPILTGAGEPPDDASLLAEALGTHSATITHWRFAAALSPHRAAALEDKTIPFDALVARSHGAGLHLVEGVGGVMVPIDGSRTVRDWAAALGYPAILVAGSYLGTISHTLSALEALRAVGVRIAALVVNETPGSSVTLEETMAGLEGFLGEIPLRARQPLVSSPQHATVIHALARELR